MKSKYLCSVLMAMLLSTVVFAQKKTEDPKYLVGAVPVVDGNVVFTREFTAQGMSEADIYRKVEAWMADVAAKTGNVSSKVVLQESEKGTAAASMDDKIVFTQSALIYDKADIRYSLVVEATDGHCTMKVQNLRYSYRQGKEKYTASELIIDKYALNKAGTKLNPGLAKWRRKTIDYVDNLATGLQQALSATQTVQTVTPTFTATPSVKKAPVYTEDTKPQKTAKEKASKLHEVAPEKIAKNAVSTDKGTLVVTIAADEFNSTTMAVNGGGSIETMQGKTVVITTFAADQQVAALDKANEYTVRFFPKGSKEPTLVLQCKKMFVQPAAEGQSHTYISEIVKAETK